MPGAGMARPFTDDERKRIHEQQQDALHRRIDNDFNRRRFNADELERSEAIHELAKTLGHAIVSTSPPSREQSLALTHLEEAVMYHTAAIARNEKENEDAPTTRAPTGRDA